MLTPRRRTGCPLATMLMPETESPGRVNSAGRLAMALSGVSALPWMDKPGLANAVASACLVRVGVSATRRNTNKVGSLGIAVIKPFVHGFHGQKG